MSTLTEEQRTVVASQRSTEASALRKVLQGDLDWIVMKCLEKDRTRRYETSNGLAADLRRYLNNELITARPPTTGYLLKKLIKRNKLAFAVASAVAGALAIGAVVATWQAVRAMRAERLATERLQESEAITKFLTGVFQSPDPARDGRTITVVETLDRAVTNLNAELANQPLRRATLQRTLADTYFGLGLGKQALSLQEQARDYYVTHYGPEDSRTLSATADLATYCSDLGQRDKALKLDEELLQIRRRVSGPEHPETIKVLVNLAVDYNLAGRLEEALRLREEALSICRRVYGPEHARTLTAMNNLAGSKARTGKLEEALNLRREVLALSRKVHGPEHPFTLMAMQNLGSSHFDLGQFREGISICEEALSIRRRVLGPAHPETLRGMQNLGILYLQAGLTDQAINIHEEALKSTEALLGREHADSITAIHNLATSYLEAGRNSQAMKLLEEEVTLSRKVNGPEHPDTLQAVLALANGLAANGRWDEALRLQEQFLPISRRVNGPEHPDTIMCLANLANSCANLGREPEAIRLHEEALALQRKVAGTAHPETIRTMNKLASLYAGAARGQEALQLREEAVRCARTGLGPEHPLTLLAIRGLANSHGAMGRPGEAAALLEEILPRVEKARGPLHPETTETIEELANWCPSTNRLLELIPRWVAGISNQPTKMSSALKVAALQVWFGEDANYSAFSQRMLAWAAKTEDAATAEQVARLACLRAGQDASTCSAALLLARRAVELGKTNSLLPLFQLARGMAEYRSGHCAEADPLLDAARQGARSLTNSLRPTVEGTSGFYLTLSLLQQGKPDEARKHFTEAEAKMKPLPAPNVNPLRDEVNGNELLLWLAWKEAKASLGKPQATESRN
jgi:tetratricopeptide (TPR) repeat protein